MAGNDSGFSASDVHDVLPRLPDVILDEAHQIAARNAEMFREAQPPPFGSAQVGGNDASSSGGGVRGASSAPQGAQGPQDQGARNAARKGTWPRRVVVLKMPVV